MLPTLLGFRGGGGIGTGKGIYGKFLQNPKLPAN
jgi:hypothetical protein